MNPLLIIDFPFLYKRSILADISTQPETGKPHFGHGIRIPDPHLGTKIARTWVQSGQMTPNDDCVMGGN